MSTCLENYTPHEVVVYCDPKNEDTTIAFKSMGVIRADASGLDPLGTDPNGIPIVSKPEYVGVLDFPFKQGQDTYPDIIVSDIAARVVPDWFTGNVYVPCTDPKYVVRDNKGQIKGVKALYLFRGKL